MRNCVQTLTYAMTTLDSTPPYKYPGRDSFDHLYVNRTVLTDFNGYYAPLIVQQRHCSPHIRAGHRTQVERDKQVFIQDMGT